MIKCVIFQLIFLVISSYQDVIITIKSDKEASEPNKYHFTVETNKSAGKKFVTTDTTELPTYTAELPKKNPVYEKVSNHHSKKRTPYKKHPKRVTKPYVNRFSRRRPLRVPYKRKSNRYFPNIFSRLQIG